MMPLLSFMFLVSASQTFVPLDTLPLTGRWEGVLTQDEGGVLPEYKFVLVLQSDGRRITGFSEVWFASEIYIKHSIEGTISQGFFLEINDGIVLNKKELKDKTYCLKTYQLVLSRAGDTWELKGRWQGTTPIGACVPGRIHLTRRVGRV